MSSASPFANVEMAPRDPILGLNEACAADTRATRVNLGVGVYYDENGNLPLLGCVAEAERRHLQAQPPRGYQPIEGNAAWRQLVQALLFGEQSALVTSARAATFQTLGGTGALKIGADFLRQLNANAQVLISNPSWENHRALFEAAGFSVGHYPYYDAASRGVDFAAMLAALKSAAAGTIVVLHACCHNPTGADLNADQWREVLAVCQQKALMPFLDIAYQGFADSLEEDALAVRLFADSGMAFLVASSFSKSFSLYGERVGALTIATASREEAERVLSQVKRVIRTNYSNPPRHGAAIVGAVLADTQLRRQWEEELGQMRERIRAMRQALVEKIAAHGCQQDFAFITAQRGMFSYTGLSAEQVERLRSESAIYAVASGRICLAALNNNNIDAVAGAIAAL